MLSSYALVAMRKTRIRIIMEMMAMLRPTTVYCSSDATTKYLRWR